MYCQLLILAALVAAVNVASAKLIYNCKSLGMFAMTWDGGPAQYTSQLLDTLQSKNVKATFHINTERLDDPDAESIIQRIVEAGHLIGLCLVDGKDLLQMDDEQIRASVVHQAMLLSTIVGYTPKFVRLPYKGFDKRVIRAIESLNFIVTAHSMGTYDPQKGSETLNNSTALSFALAKGYRGLISTQYDNIPRDVDIAGRIIGQAKAYGYRLVKLDECLGVSPDLQDVSDNVLSV
jgi:peptidoglycan/xylan/chitin deacetylase (PgdA/CDA1 family)